MTRSKYIPMQCDAERVHVCHSFLSLEHRFRSDRMHMAFQLNRANDKQTMVLMNKIAYKVEKRIIITEHIQTFDSPRVCVCMCVPRGWRCRGIRDEKDSTQKSIERSDFGVWKLPFYAHCSLFDCDCALWSRNNNKSAVDTISLTSIWMKQTRLITVVVLKLNINTKMLTRNGKLMKNKNEWPWTSVPWRELMDERSGANRA